MDKLALTERMFAEQIAQSGGRVFRVGGCIRDQLMGVTPKDIDFCIVGMVKKNFKQMFPTAEEYGKSFPVFRLLIDGLLCELAFARTERKVSSGYKGFKVSSNPKVTIEEDLFRRDTTVNSIAMDCLTGEIIDPYHGTEDIQNKLLRATSEHFSDDPMRALRLASQSARLGFAIEADTLRLAAAVALELSLEPVERVLMELTKVLASAQQPGQFFRVLAKTQLLQITFQEMAKLSVEDFTLVLEKLDAVAKLTCDPKLRFATLGFVVKKESLLRWNEQMTLPADWLQAAIITAENSSLLKDGTAENIVTAIHSLRRGSLCTEEFDIITKGIDENYPELHPLKLQMALLLKERAPQTLQGKAIGQWLWSKQVEIIGKIVAK